jgi:hypothetical protein
MTDGSPSPHEKARVRPPTVPEIIVAWPPERRARLQARADSLTAAGWSESTARLIAYERIVDEDRERRNREA